MNSLWKSFFTVVNKTASSVTNTKLSPFINEFIPQRFKTTVQGLRASHLYRLEHPIKKKPCALDGKPFAKGLILKTIVKKPRKPNSANRKCVVVKLTTGKIKVAYVPGEGHNLQEHQYVLVRNSKLKDVPGVKLKCIRGAYDLPHVSKKK